MAFKVAAVPVTEVAASVTGAGAAFAVVNASSALVVPPSVLDAAT